MKQILRRLIALTLALLTCMSLMTLPASAATERVVKVRVNGYLVNFPDQQPYVNSDGRTLIPVRFVAETLGATVYWDRGIQGAVIEKDGMKIELPIGKTEMTVTHADGKVEVITMNTAAVLKNGRTLVPIRFVAEAMGCYVDFSSAYQTVQIYKDVLTPAEIKEIRQLASGNEWCDEKLNLKNSSTPWANINEHAFQEFKFDWDNSVYMDYIPTPNDPNCGGWNNKTGTKEQLANYIIRRARANVATTFFSQMYGAKATFRTDASAITTNTSEDTTHPYVIYGYLTVTFDKNADIAGYKKMNRTATNVMTNVQPGKSYTYLVEAHMLPSATMRYPLCMQVWNRTGGARVRMW